MSANTPTATPTAASAAPAAPASASATKTPFSLKDFVVKNFNLIAIAILIIVLFYYLRNSGDTFKNLSILGGSSINNFQ
jgi:hypothetical protein